MVKNSAYGCVRRTRWVGCAAPLMRNLPPEAQAMIEVYRRRRAERANNQTGGQPQPAQRVRRTQT